MSADDSGQGFLLQQGKTDPEPVKAPKVEPSRSHFFLPGKPKKSDIPACESKVLTQAGSKNTP